MLGTDKEPGIYVRTLNDLFHAIEETSDDMLYSVSMSYLEASLQKKREKNDIQAFILDMNPNGQVDPTLQWHKSGLITPSWLTLFPV